MFINTDYSGFMEATHSHLYLILIHLRRARENVFTSLFKSKSTSKTGTGVGEEWYVMLTYQEHC